MSRPTYVTSEDVNKAWACVCRLAAAYGYGAYKNPGQYSRIDFLLLSQSRRAPGHAIWVEVKCRTHAFGQFPTLLISAMKWKEGIELARTTGAGFCILVNYTDGDYFYGYKPAHVADGRVYLEHGGRTRNTRDGGDIEPVMHIPMSLFQKVTTQESP